MISKNQGSKVALRRDQQLTIQTFLSFPFHPFFTVVQLPRVSQSDPAKPHVSFKTLKFLPQSANYVLCIH